MTCDRIVTRTQVRTRSRSGLLIGTVAGGVLALTAGCGASYPTPTQPLADVQAADRSAQELGANADPAARLHLTLAQEQAANATKLMKDGENKRAESLLLRAKADAELALSLARETKAKAALQEATEKANVQTTNQGAPK